MALETKRALPIQGTFKGLFRFTIYKTRYNKIVSSRRVDMLGYCTRGNVERNKEIMVRVAHENAWRGVKAKLGSTFKYSSKLMAFTFIYDTGLSRGREGKRISVDYLNSQVPETEQRTIVYQKERKKYARAKTILRGKGHHVKNISSGKHKKGKHKVSRVKKKSTYKPKKFHRKQR